MKGTAVAELLEMLQAAKASGLGMWGVGALIAFWVLTKLARGVGTRAVSYVTEVLKQSETVRVAQADYIKQLEQRIEWLTEMLAECQGSNT
jgi:hypothetical protein